MRSLNFYEKVVVMPVAFAFILAIHAVPCAAQVDVVNPVANDTPALTAANVNTIISQAVGYLQGIGESGIISVADREGHILAIFRMTPLGSSDPRINEQATVKARTASFFESKGDAFTTRTAQFIVQSNFPPGVRNVDAGPLFGVPFSNQPGADVQLQVPPAIAFVNPLNAPGPLAAPPGTSNSRPLQQPLVITPLTDDPGGLPLFINRQPVGSVGVEVDGFGVLGNGVPDAGVGRTNTGIVPSKSKQLIEETAALVAIQGFDSPGLFRADKISVNGFRFPYVSVRRPAYTPVDPATLPTLGKFEPYFDTTGDERSPSGAPLAFDPYAALPVGKSFSPTAVVMNAVRPTPQQEFPLQGWVARFPARNSPLGGITKADVIQMVQQAADQAFATRAAIRNPIGVSAAVWITVVDLQGNILGLFRTNDATVFSFDLCVQKARTAAFFSTNNVGFTSRAIGFMSQTFYPPGVEEHPPGPISGLLPYNGGDAGALGDRPTGFGAAPLTQISQLLTDDSTNTLVPIVLAAPPSPMPPFPAVPPVPPFAQYVTQNAVQLLARRLPHIRDGRISPLQVSIFVDLSLRSAYGVGSAPPPTLKNGICIFPGGVPIYKNGILVGGLGISGDGVDQDDVIAFNGARGFQPPDGVRCDNVSEVDVIIALNKAVAKLKVEFPNLTNNDPASPEVIDVVQRRLVTGPVLEGLRLPYVKFPRSANRNNK